MHVVEIFKPHGLELNYVKNVSPNGLQYFCSYVLFIIVFFIYFRLQKNVKAASEAEYPAYGVTGPTKERTPSPGDRKLAQSAQMYHYQHQKQQMLALEK